MKHDGRQTMPYIEISSTRELSFANIEWKEKQQMIALLQQGVHFLKKDHL